MDWCSSGLPPDFTMGWAPGHLAMSKRWPAEPLEIGDTDELRIAFSECSGGLYGNGTILSLQRWLAGWKASFLDVSCYFLSAHHVALMCSPAFRRLGPRSPRVNGSISRYICLRLHANILDELAGNCQKDPKGPPKITTSRDLAEVDVFFFSMTSHPE